MKVRSLLMALALVVATGVGCGSGAQAERDDQAATTQQAQTEEQTVEEDTEASDDAVAQADTQDRRDKMAKKKGMEEHCPMAVEGTEVSAENTEDGVAMVFTTEGDVEELRERVEWMAQHHTKMMQGHGKMKGHGKKHGEKMKGQAKGHDNKREGKMKGHGKMAQMENVSVSAEEVDQGARLVFTAGEEADVETLQQHINQHVEKVQQGSCPMMHGKPKNKAGAEQS